MSTVIEVSYSCIPLTTKKSRVGNSANSSRQPLPGWKEEIAPLKKNSLFWHSVLLSAGKPTVGALHSIMVHTRMKYHRSIKFAKKLVASFQARSLLTAAESGNIAFLRELGASIHKKTHWSSCSNLFWRLQKTETKSIFSCTKCHFMIFHNLERATSMCI